MSPARRLLTGFIAIGLLFVHLNSFAQRIPDEWDWDPFDGVTKVVDWFMELNSKFDRLVANEQRAQLIRSVDRLRKNLYTLEADTQLLLDSIPDERPVGARREQLMVFVDDLMETVERLSSSVRDIGADLRLNEAIEIEARLTYGLRSRKMVLTYLENCIGRSDSLTDTSPHWDAVRIRGRIRQGLAAVKDAQLAATKFRQKLLPH